jgi:hypothetical protein
MTCDHQTRQTAALNLDGTDAFKTKRNPSPRIETLDELRKTFSKVGHVPVEQKQDFRGLSRSSKPPKSSKLTIVRIQLFQLERRHPDDVSISIAFLGFQAVVCSPQQPPRARARARAAPPPPRPALPRPAPPRPAPPRPAPLRPALPRPALPSGPGPGTCRAAAGHLPAAKFFEK